MRLEFTYTPDDLKQALRSRPWFGLRNARVRFAAFIGWLLFVAVATVIFVWLKRAARVPRPRPPLPPSPVDQWLLPLIPWVLVAAFLWLFVFRRLRRVSQRLWETNPVFQLPQTVEVGEEGIRVSSNLVDTLYRWPYFIAWSESRDVLLLHLPNHVRVMIPKRSAGNEHELNGLRDIIKTRVHQPTRGFPVEVKRALPLSSPDNQ